MAKHRRSTKAAYARLFDDPSALFGEGTQVTFYPNGEPEIWIQGPKGHGFRIKASSGRAGFGLSIDTFIGGPVTTLHAMANGEEVTEDVDRISGVSLTQYNGDEWSQAFKRWYAHEGEYPGDKE